MNDEVKNSSAPATQSSVANGDYALWLKELKAKIRSVQVRAALAASRELILFYWELGGELSRKLAETHWGDREIGRASCRERVYI